MVCEEDIARLLGAEDEGTDGRQFVAPELEEAWAMIVAARTLLHDHPLENDKRACALRLQQIAARQIEAAGHGPMEAGDVLLLFEPLDFH